MTESEWLECTDPKPMLDYLRDKTEPMKFIQFCLDWCPLYAMETMEWASFMRQRGQRGTSYVPADHECPPLIREFFSNPFRPLTINPIWLTPTVTNLAQSAYDERIMLSGELDPARLAVLSDALEEAGCDDADLLNHLRSPGPHVRGCWAVDVLLGKE